MLRRNRPATVKVWNYSSVSRWQGKRPGDYQAFTRTDAPVAAMDILYKKGTVFKNAHEQSIYIDNVLNQSFDVTVKN